MSGGYLNCVFFLLYSVLQEIGAKQRIMELMTHEDQEVRYQALLAVQKYMHQAW